MKYTMTITASGWQNLWMFGALRRRIRWMLARGNRHEGPLKYRESGWWDRHFEITGEHHDLTSLFFTVRELTRRGWWVGDWSGVELVGPSHTVEQTWVTKAGLTATVLLTKMGHRCGYVVVPDSHPLYRAAYDVPHPALAPVLESEPVGKRSPVLVFTASKENLTAPSPELAFDVHGGITYSGEGYWLDGESGWHFGFDAAHCDDLPAPDSEMDALAGGFLSGLGGEHRTLEYMMSECERLAEQLVGPKVRAITFVDRLLYQCAKLSKLVHRKLWYVRRVRLPHLFRHWPELAKKIRGF